MNYLEKFINIHKYEKPNELNNTDALTTLVNGLTTLEMRSFIEDFLLQEKKEINQLFVSSKMVSAEEAAFDWLMDLPSATLDKATSAFEIVLDKAMGKKYGKKSRGIASKIKAIVARKKIGLSAFYLKDKIKEDGLSVIEKLDLWFLLSNLDEFNQDNQYLEREISIDKNPELVPVLITAFQKVNPEKAFRIFARLNNTTFKPTESQLRYFKAGLKFTLYNFHKPDYEKKVKDFLEIKNQITNHWMLELIDEIMKHPKFHLINKEIENFESINNLSQKMLSQMIERLETSNKEIRPLTSGIQRNDIFRKVSQIFRGGSDEIRKVVHQKISSLDHVSRLYTIDHLSKHNIGFFFPYEIVDLNDWKIRSENYGSEEAILNAIMSNKNKLEQLDQLTQLAN